MTRFFHHLSATLRHYSLLLGVAAVTAFIGIIGIMMSLERNQAIALIKEQILKIEESLMAAGYDIAYDHLSFSHISPWQIMRIQNLRLYSLDAGNYKEWQCDEFSVSSNFFSSDKIRFHFSSRQALQLGKHSWKMDAPQVSAEMTTDENGNFKDFIYEAENLTIQKLLGIENIKFAARRNLQKEITGTNPFIETFLNAKNILIADYTGWPMNKEIGHIYVNANIMGAIESQPILNDALYSWIENNGYIDIAKMIINWKPLVMVAKGELYFDEHLSPDLSLNTSSLALTEILDKFNQYSWLEDKGVFVAKILLNNKSFKKNQTDSYYTVTTPVRINNKQILIENIPVKKF